MKSNGDKCLLRLAGFVLAFFPLTVANSGEVDFDKTFGQVAEKIVLEIENIAFSKHIVLKNLREHILSLSEMERRQLASDANSIENWVESFIDSRCLIPEGYRLGLHQSAFTFRNLGIMERYLLTDPSAEGYDRLLQVIAADEQADSVQSWEFRKPIVEREHIERRKRQLSIAYKDSAIQEFVRSLPQAPSPSLSIEEEWIAGIESIPIADYQKAGDRVHFTISDFANYYNREVFRTHPNTYQTAVDYINKWLIQDLDFAEAIRRRITEDPKFRQDRKNYIHKLIIEQFKNDIVTPEAQLNDDEVVAYYTSNKGQFKGETEVLASIERFDSIEQAYQRYHLFHTESIIPDSRKALVVKRDSTNIHEKIRDVAFSISLKTASTPIHLEDGYAIVFKHEVRASGSLELDFVEKHIRNTLLSLKIENKTLEKIESLKREFTIDDRIDRGELLEFAQALALPRSPIDPVILPNSNP